MSFRRPFCVGAEEAASSLSWTATDRCRPSGRRLRCYLRGRFFFLLPGTSTADPADAMIKHDYNRGHKHGSNAQNDVYSVSSFRSQHEIQIQPKRPHSMIIQILNTHATVNIHIRINYRQKYFYVRKRKQFFRVVVLKP